MSSYKLTIQIRHLICYIMLLAFIGCNIPETPGDKSYKQEIEQWNKQRVEGLKSRDGWLNLAGLFWLEPGENTIGSDSGNSIIFPLKAPSLIGKYTLVGNHIIFNTNPGIEVRSGDSLVTSMEISSDNGSVPTILETGTLAWFIIKRGDRFGIRLRDFENPAVIEFHGIETYKPHRDWIIEARFEAYPEPREMFIPTVLGTTEKSWCPGILKFTVDGIDQELYPSQSGQGLFIVFADETSGLDTYGGGRFLYTQGPDDNDRVALDFNKAYNPPCAFTPFATCPLPSRENYLTISVTAGEKFAGH
jgi:uncharacterized protein